MNKRIRSTKSYLTACLIGFVLAACSGDDTVAVSYAAYNHTDKSIVSIVINGEGGILDASAHGGGGSMCCVILPRRWRPGLMATIKWQLDGDWLKDEQGKEVIRDGKTVLVPGPWKERTVEVPKYTSEGDLGTFFIHIFPGDEVKVLMNIYDAGNPQHPLPHPSGFKREG